MMILSAVPMKYDLHKFGLELVKDTIAEGGTSKIHKVEVVGKSNFGNLGTHFALKDYKPAILEIEGQRDRIVQEISLMEQIDHLNVVRTFGLLSMDDTSTLHLLEWVEGQTLQAWIKLESLALRTWDLIRNVAVATHNTNHSRPQSSRF